MFIYLLVFFILLVLSNIYVKTNEKKKKIVLSIIILLLSVLGGVRASNIGTDVMVYGERWFNISVNTNSLSSLLKIIQTTDIGYVILNYIVSRFTDNFNVFLFVHQLIINILICTTIAKYCKNGNIILGLLFYYFVYYFRTYNLLRQAVALAIVLWSVRYLIENKKIKYIISILIAAQFHATAYFCILTLIIYMLLRSTNKYRKIFILLISFVSIICVINLLDIMTILYNMGIINDRIYAYTYTFIKSEVSFNLIEFMIKIAGIIISSLYIFGYKKEIDKNDKFLYLIMVLDLIVSQTSNFISYAGRLAYYYGTINVIFLPNVIEKVSYNKQNYVIFNIISIGLLFAYWFITFIVNKSCEVYPYQSIF